MSLIYVVSSGCRAAIHVLLLHLSFFSFFEKEDDPRCLGIAATSVSFSVGHVGDLNVPAHFCGKCASIFKGTDSWFDVSPVFRFYSLRPII